MTISAPSMPSATPGPAPIWPWWATALAWVPLGVFVALGIFAYPGLDDWHFHNIAIHRGIIGGTWDHLMGWGGRYAVIPMNLVFYNLPGQDLLFPLAVMGNLLLLPWSIRLLLPAGTPRPWPVAVALASLVVVSLPSPAQGLYWLCGMFAYTFPLHLIAPALYLVKTPAKTAPGFDWRGPGAAALGLLIAGFGETVTILAGGSALLVASFGRHRAWWLIGGLTVGLGIDIAMPGTWARLHVSRPQGSGQGPARIASNAWHVVWGFIAACLQRTDCVAALLIAAYAGAVRTGNARLPTPWLAPLVPFMLWAAVVPSIAALGIIEGRQCDAVWLALLLWMLAGAWWLGAFRPEWFARQHAGDPTPRALVVGVLWMILTALMNAGHIADSLTALAVGVPALLLVAGSGLMLLHRNRPACLIVAMAGAVLCSVTFQTAVWDLFLHAPMRRLGQFSRDREVAALAAQGARHVRFPLANADYFPVTISVGDFLGAKRWDSAAYAGCFDLLSAGSDPRLDHAIATDAAGHALPPGVMVPTGSATAPVMMPEAPALTP